MVKNVLQRAAVEGQGKQQSWKGWENSSIGSKLGGARLEHTPPLGPQSSCQHVQPPRNEGNLNAQQIVHDT